MELNWRGTHDSSVTKTVHSAASVSFQNGDKVLPHLLENYFDVLFVFSQLFYARKCNCYLYDVLRQYFC